MGAGWERLHQRWGLGVNGEDLDQRGNEKILLVTNDLGPRLKAKKFGVECLVPDPSHELKSPEDELEKAIKNLKKENEQLKNLIPKLSVTFKNREKVKKYALAQVSENKEDFIDYEMEIIKNKYPVYPAEPVENSLENKPDHSHSHFIEFKNLLDIIKEPRISKEDKEEYNSKLHEFYKDYEYYLELLFDYKAQSELTLEVLFDLNNEGTSPAEDIDIYFHFPDGFELYDEESYPQEPIPPDAPEKPRSIYEPFRPPYMHYTQLGHKDLSSIIPDPNVSNPIIKKTNSYDVEVHIRKLKHNESVSLDKMLVVFSDYESIINFKVDYKMTCSNVPNVVNGSLNFNVEKLTNL